MHLVIVFKGPTKCFRDHLPDQEECEAESVKARIKRKAEDESDMSPAQVLRLVLPNVPLEVIALLPERENSKKKCKENTTKKFSTKPYIVIGELS